VLTVIWLGSMSPNLTLSESATLRRSRPDLSVSPNHDPSRGEH
jgi:hypothetical protein